MLSTPPSCNARVLCYDISMIKKGGRPAAEKLHLYEKRQELIWALDHQGYDGDEIALVFSLDRSQISRLLKKKPSDWQPRWVKSQ